MNTEQINLFYDILGHKNQTEIRGISKGLKPEIKTIFVNNKDDFFKNVQIFNNEGYCVFAGLNERIENGTKMDDVISLKWFIIDLDSEVEEVKNAVESKLKHCQLIYKYKIATGHGYHYYFPIKQINNNNDIQEFLVKCKYVLTSLNTNIDKKVYDPSRVVRVWGTENKKDKKNIKDVVVIEERKDYNEENNYYNILDIYEDSIKEIKSKQYNQPVYTSNYEIPLFTYLNDNPLQQENINKNDILFKNMAAYIFQNYGDTEKVRNLLKEFAKKNKHNPSEILCWFDKCVKGDITECNIGELINWNKKHKLGLEQYIVRKEKSKIKNFNVIPIKKLNEMNLPPLKYQIPNFILDSGLTIFAGKAGSGKSFAALDAGLAIAMGNTFLNKIPAVKGNVIYMDEENGLRRLKARVNSLTKGDTVRYKNYNYENFYFISFDDVKIDALNTKEIFTELIKEYKPTLIILDSIVRMMDGKENDVEDAKKVINNLRKLAEELNISFLLLHHANKAGSGMDAVRGSGDYMNGVDIGYLFTSTDKKYYKQISLIKNRDRGEDEANEFIMHMNGQYLPDSKLEDSNLTLQWMNTSNFEEQKDNRTTLEKCVDDIKIYIQQNNYTEIQTGSDNHLFGWLKNKYKKLSINTFENAINELERKNIIVKEKRGIYKIIKNSCVETTASDFGIQTGE